MSSYTSFIKGTTITVDNMNNNFNYIGAGDWIPMSGATLTTDTTELLDIGSQSNRWNTAYVNNLNLDGEMSKAFNLIAEYNLNTTTSRIEFDNLNGDSDEIYLLNVYGLSKTNAAFGIGLYLNGDSGSNYGFQRIDASASSVVALRNSTSRIEVGTLRGSNTVTWANSTVYTKTGNERVAITEMLDSGINTTISKYRLFGQVWNDTSSTITSLVFSSSGNMVTGTNIQVWAKVATITTRNIGITTT